MTNVYVTRDRDGKISCVFAGKPTGLDLEILPRDNPDVVVFLAPAPAEYYIISKMTPWLRMTNEEADLVYRSMAAADARTRAIYDAAPFLQSNDPLWPVLRGMLENCLPSQRADELLAPET
ncbi:hypothetical protein [Rhizobium leguminosarum]|uniref:hypothetical protein n=1 Tax=Rhizobium leguminosarum TaxID=384 RepID=UPI001C961653|nr:hypothetical protein [Rhizobium leguminosarum]MBY5796447.1 hypothetical protein [Rhizobium leguminosarum]